MKLLSERLTWAVAEKQKRDGIRIPRAKLAAVCRATRTSATHWMSGGGITAAKARLLADFLGVDPIWLETGKGSPMPHARIPSRDAEYVIAQYHDVSASMGPGLILRDQPGQITQWGVTKEWVHKNIPHNTGIKNLCIVTGFGDSMRGMFNSGDPLIVDTGIKAVEYDAVYFFRVGEEGFIKRLQRIPGEGLRVLSKNPDYETWTIKKDMDFAVFGRVLKVWKSEEL